jgi:hypothetical protein
MMARLHHKNHPLAHRVRAGDFMDQWVENSVLLFPVSEYSHEVAYTAIHLQVS